MSVSTTAMRVGFPLLMAIGFQAENKEWLHLLAADAAVLHITAFAVEGFIDRILRCQDDNVNLAAEMHFQKGVNLLRERLSGDDDQDKISDSTMGVVLKLASVAHFNGDFRAARDHMEGLRKMVDLRGGLGVFKGKHMLMEVLRYNIARLVPKTEKY